MATDDKKSIKRSEKIEKILSEDPPWILRWGNMLLFLLFAAAGGVLYALYLR